MYANGATGFKRNMELNIGLRARGDQEFLLQLGAEEGSLPYNLLVGCSMHGITLDGGGFVIPGGLLRSELCSQAKLHRVNIRRVRGPVVWANYMEDFQFFDCNFGLCGNNDGVPGFVFSGRRAQEDEVAQPGNNVVSFYGGRFEFCDGPLIGTDPDSPKNPWVSTVQFIGTKFEAGAETINGTTETYGSHSADYFMWDFRDGSYIRKIIQAKGLHMSAISRAAGVFAIGDFSQFLIDGVQMSSGGAAANLRLYQIETRDGSMADARGVDIRNLNLRQFAASPTTPTFSWVNKSKRPVRLEIPEHDAITGLARIENRRWNGVMYAADVASSNTGMPTLAMDPNPTTDPCISPWGTVASSIGTADEIMVRLGGKDYSAIPGFAGFTEGMPGVVKVSVRCKSDAASGTSRIDVSHGPASGSTRYPINFTNTSWEWRHAYLRLSAGENLRIRGNAANPAGARLYIDAVKVEPVQWVDIDHQRATPLTIPAESTISVGLADTSWAKAGHNVHVSPPAPVDGVVVSAHVSVDGAVRVTAQNTTAASVSLAPGVWKLRLAV